MTKELMIVAFSSLSAIETGSIYIHNNLLPPGVRSTATQFRSSPRTEDDVYNYDYYYIHYYSFLQTTCFMQIFNKS